MERKSLARRLLDGEVPLVLAGPIVRRVTTESASVWIATRDRCDVTLTITEQVPAGAPPRPPEVASAPTIRIGERLHMAVVTVKPQSPFTAGARCTYNMTFAAPSATPAANGDLFTPGIIVGQLGTQTEAKALLTYETDGPSFQIPPPELADLRILHTSCRKIMGEGTDAFGAFDVMFAEHFTAGSTEKRPSLLVLHGDNVYQDGTEEELLPAVIDAATTLMGFDEQPPGLDKPLSQVNPRAAETLDKVGMSGARAFRSFGLGESIALHLMTFADVVWPVEADYNPGGFRATMKLSTRRILANVATYMTFDDHEVGNSWAICFDWVQSVWSKPLGRRVYQNSLAAFALCQAWGNTPDQFEVATPKRPGAEFLDLIVRWSAAQFHGSSLSDQDQQELEIRLGIPVLLPDGTFHIAPGFLRELERLHSDASIGADDPDQLAEPQIRWDFTVPAGKAQLCVLDVHTWSEYDRDPFIPVQRMPATAWDRQLVPTQPGFEVAIVVISNVAIMEPRAWSKALYIVEHGLEPKDRDVITNALKSGAKLALKSTIPVALLLFAVHQAFGLIGILVILFAVAAVLIALAIFYGIKFSAYLWLAGVPGAVWRSLQNIYTDEVGYNFEWASTPFERLLSRLAAHYGSPATPARVVILSGDVHHSYAMRLEYWADRRFEGGTPASAVFAQLVGSPSKYVSTSVGSFKDDQTARHFAGWSHPLSPELGPGTSSHNLFWNDAPFIGPFSPDGPSPRYVTPAQWIYKIEPQPQKDRPTTRAQVTKPSALNDKIQTLDVKRRMVWFGVRDEDYIRSNNVSELTFDWTVPKVRHRVWWWFLDEENPQPDSWLRSVFEVDMASTPRPVVPT
jgi:hypothetical protein